MSNSQKAKICYRSLNSKAFDDFFTSVTGYLLFFCMLFIHLWTCFFCVLHVFKGLPRGFRRPFRAFSEWGSADVYLQQHGTLQEKALLQNLKHYLSILEPCSVWNQETALSERNMIKKHTAERTEGCIRPFFVFSAVSLICKECRFLDWVQYFRPSQRTFQ